MTEPKVRRLRTAKETLAEVDREEALAAWREFRRAVATQLEPARLYMRAFALGFRARLMHDMREAFVASYMRTQRVVAAELSEQGELER